VGTHIRFATIAVLAAAIGLLSPPVAGAATMGTPLGIGPFTGPPTNRYDCTAYDTRIEGVFPIVSPTGTGVASECVWIDTPTADPSASFSPNTYGNSIVTQVRVAVGQTTGPMEAVVMRGLYENTATPGKPIYACCLFMSASPSFTPQVNSVTAVNVDLPMRQDPTPPPEDTTTVAVNDILGLAVLEPGVPVPMYDIGDPATINYLWNTATPSSQTPSFSGDTYGFHVAMQADYTAAAGAANRALTRRVLARSAPVLPSARMRVAISGAGGPVSIVSGTRTAPTISDTCANDRLCIGPDWLF
jgi:hypothetical protein